MKNLTRILTTVLCFAPFAYAAAAPVATTAGDNLTAFNPSNANNNQWATLSNGRYDSNVTAKVDFGNCNAVILRCAQPKCANGGCADISVASAIVKGCVQSNDSCKQYGDDLVAYMSAQLVANSNAKINEQNAAAANAAAQAAAQQSQQQMQQMQYQMQQMQYQMAQQQEQSQQQLQEALAQQAAQSAAALESMKTAATNAAMENEAGISAYQQDAINRGISADVLERQKITGQVLTEIENAEASLKEVKVAMNTAFEYAKCDSRGNNCEGPKRIKKWRELATEFLTPYDNTIDKVYDALELAQLVGVDLSDIYMMLNNSCNRWGQYMCPGAGDESHEIYYGYQGQKESEKSTPRVCEDDPASESDWKNCRPCTLLKVLTSQDEVYEGWVNATYDAKDNTTVVACASGALDSTPLFSRRTKNKNGAGLVDIDKLDVWLHQTEPSKKYAGVPPMDYCNAGADKHILEKSMLSKIVPVNNVPLCVASAGNSTGQEDEYCGFINPIYAICDVHPYNAGKTNAYESSNVDDKNDYTKQARAACKQKKPTDGNCDQILWAEKSSNNNYEVKLCKEKFKPVQDSSSKVWYCDSQDSCRAGDYKKEDGQTENADTECVGVWNEYRDMLAAKYGETREMVGLKTTVISQQMYKQYEYLNATLRRLKTQLEKAVLTAKLQAAGAKTEDSSSSSSGLLGAGGSNNSQYGDCTGKEIQEMIYCLRQNYAALAGQINSKKCNKTIKDQLKNDIAIIKGQIPNKADYVQITTCTDKVDDCKSCLQVYNTGINTLDEVKLDRDAKRAGRYRD